MNPMKKEAKNISRRDFAKVSAMALGAVPFLGYSGIFRSEPTFNNTELSVHLFSKHLQFLNYTEMAEAASEMGFDGLDLTVRPKGPC